MKFPNEINILGIKYKVEYCDVASDVDGEKRVSYWGQIDHWDQKIRIYKNNMPESAIFRNIMEEILHGIFSHLEMESMNTEEIVGRLTVALVDTLERNNFIKFKDK